MNEEEARELNDAVLKRLGWVWMQVGADSRQSGYWETPDGIVPPHSPVADYTRMENAIKLMVIMGKKKTMTVSLTTGHDWESGKPWVFCMTGGDSTHHSITLVEYAEDPGVAICLVFASIPVGRTW